VCWASACQPVRWLLQSWGCGAVDPVSGLAVALLLCCGGMQARQACGWPAAALMALALPCILQCCCEPSRLWTACCCPAGPWSCCALYIGMSAQQAGDGLLLPCSFLALALNVAVLWHVSQQAGDGFAGTTLALAWLRVLQGCRLRAQQAVKRPRHVPSCVPLTRVACAQNYDAPSWYYGYQGAPARFCVSLQCMIVSALRLPEMHCVCQRCIMNIMLVWQLRRHPAETLAASARAIRLPHACDKFALSA